MGWFKYQKCEDLKLFSVILKIYCTHSGSVGKCRQKLHKYTVLRKAQLTEHWSRQITNGQDHSHLYYCQQEDHAKVDNDQQKWAIEE